MEGPGHLVLETRGLTRRFGETLAVSGIDVAIGEGVVYGLLGRNDAGKTTLLRMILSPRPGRMGSERPADDETATRFCLERIMLQLERSAGDSWPAGLACCLLSQSGQ
jgi:ABC-type uncharacterized transport system ATPase subunit